MNKFLLIFIITAVVAGLFYFAYNSYINSKAPKDLVGDEYKSDIVKGKTLKYRYFLPGNQTEKLPLVVYFHGAGERGNDNLSHLNSASLKWIDPSVQNQHPCYVLIPQCEKQNFWVNIKFSSFPFVHYNQDKIPISDELKLFMQLLSEFVQKNNVDTNRIYLVGFSMGSTAVWDLLTRFPDKFAASINMAGTSDTSKAKLITHIPIKVFNGDNDPYMPLELNTEMCNKIKEHGGNVELTIYKGVGHDCTDLAYNTPGIFDWLFTQKKQ
jgi:predicted peptidase